MAQSRLEKIGTVYTRTSALLRAGAMKPQDKPFWMNIYETFPPKYEPSFDRPPQGLNEVKPIFYLEDQVRAKFHKQFPMFTNVNLLDDPSTSKTAIFLKIYMNLETEYETMEQIFNKAVEEFKAKVKIETAEKLKRRKEFNPSKGTKILTQSVIDNKIDAKKTVENVAKNVRGDKEEEEETKYTTIKLRLDKVFEKKNK